jgi:hypothetical protein
MYHHWHGVDPLWARITPSDPPDHWLNVVLGAAGLFTVIGILVGAMFTLRYGRVV